MTKMLVRIFLVTFLILSISELAYSSTPILASSPNPIENFFLGAFKSIVAFFLFLIILFITIPGQLLILGFKYTYGFERFELETLLNIDQLEPISIAFILKMVLPVIGVPLSFMVMIFSGLANDPETVRLIGVFILIACILDIFSEAVAVFSLFFAFVGSWFTGTFDILVVFNFIVSFAGFMPPAIADTATAISTIGFIIGLGSTWYALFATDDLDAEKTEVFSGFLNKVSGGFWGNQ